MSILFSDWLNFLMFDVRHSFVSAKVFGLPSSTGPLGFSNKVCDNDQYGIGSKPIRAILL